MQKNPKKAKLEKAAEILVNSEYLVAFTGAGISAESGVPTYRGEDGLWNKYDPEKTATLSGFKDDPDKFWGFIRDMAVAGDISPNPAHQVLADWEENNILQAIITQNIDLLHQQAGSEEVLELHGSLQTAECYGCGRKYNWQWIEEKLEENEIPVCKDCGSKKIKPNVVFFGEMLPQDTIRAAEQEARKCEVMLVIGSSLAVHPAASLPARARQTGAQLIYVNADKGERPELFDVILEGKAGKVIPEMHEKIQKLNR